MAAFSQLGLAERLHAGLRRGIEPRPQPPHREPGVGIDRRERFEHVGGHGEVVQCPESVLRRLEGCDVAGDLLAAVQRRRELGDVPQALELLADVVLFFDGEPLELVGAFGARAAKVLQPGAHHIAKIVVETLGVGQIGVVVVGVGFAVRVAQQVEHERGEVDAAQRVAGVIDGGLRELDLR
jgi:hypothetical protein